MNPNDPTEMSPGVQSLNVRGYDCTNCEIHFEAETPHGDAFEFDPDCPQCGDKTGLNCTPCYGDRRNVSAKQLHDARRDGLDVTGECAFPKRFYSGTVTLVTQ